MVVFNRDMLAKAALVLAVIPLVVSMDGKKDQERRLQKVEEDVAEIRAELLKLTTMLGDNRVQSKHRSKRQASSSSSSSKEETDDEYEQLLADMPLNAFAGLRGPPGRNGKDGSDGRDGTPGATGQPGIMGPPGVPGAVGAPGRDGSWSGVGGAGPTGSPGAKGEAGEPGAPGVPGYSGNSTGTIYTRWGRKSCGSYSGLIYEGFAASSRYDHMGGGVNYLCMPKSPEYNSYSSLPVSSWLGSWLAGVEYQSHYYGIFSRQTHDQNVPCARCYTNSRSALMMLPAKRTCPSGWLKEYEGYLMTGARLDHNHQSDYVCVDASPEHISGQSGDTNGALFYFVRPFCSGMATIGHCPPYYSNRELTCVVCSR